MKKLAIAAIFVASASTVAGTVGVRTSCGIITYTISEETYYNEGHGWVGSYEEYLREVNKAICNEDGLPLVFDTDL